MALDPPFVMPFKTGLKNDGDDTRLRRIVEQLEKRDRGLDERVTYLEEHPGGGASFGLYAARPAAGTAGRTYYPSNSPIWHMDNGVTWDAFHPLVNKKITPPILADFTDTVGLGVGHTITQGGEDLYLHDTATASVSVRGVYKAAPTPPYTITASFLRNGFFALSGLWMFWGQTSAGTMAAGKMAGIGAQMDPTVLGIYSAKWTDATTFSATYAAAPPQGTFLGQPNFFRLTDDGSDRIVSVSHDGVNFNVLHAVGRSDFLTPDRVGIGWYSQSTNQPFGACWMSWNEAGGL